MREAVYSKTVVFLRTSIQPCVGYLCHPFVYPTRSVDITIDRQAKAYLSIKLDETSSQHRP